MSPLQRFMTDLLRDHDGDIQLVADNARTTAMQQTRKSVPEHLPLTSTSNHSASRWECIEPSMTTKVVMNQKSRAKMPSLQRRPAVLVANDNTSGPACPIRKLSKENNEGRDAVRVKPHRYSVVFKASKSHTQSHKPSTSNDSSRPPMSPAKKQKAKPKKNVPSKNRIVVLCKPTTHKKKMTIAKSLLPIKRTLSPIQVEPSSIVPSSSRVSSQQGQQGRQQLLPLDTQHEQTSLRLGIFPPTPFEPEMPLVGMLKRPARGLSKTLLGIDVTEKAPVCPRRRPSTQSDYVSPSPLPKSSIELAKLSEHSNSTLSTSASTSNSSSKPSVRDIRHRDILVLPPPPEFQTTMSPSAPSGGTGTNNEKKRSTKKSFRVGGGRPIFFQRLTSKLR